MKYFTIEELCKSNVALANNINNTPSAEVKKNLERLVDKVLDPLREKFGKPIIVNSGYRSERVNKLAGGSKTSHHKFGFAADIQSIGDEYNKELFELCKQFNFDQLIDEYDLSWIHISYVSPEENRNEILKAIKKNNKTIYTKIN